jgi:hypothetical protein
MAAPPRRPARPDELAALADRRDRQRALVAVDRHEPVSGLAVEPRDGKGRRGAGTLRQHVAGTGDGLVGGHRPHPQADPRELDPRARATASSKVIVRTRRPIRGNSIRGL